MVLIQGQQLWATIRYGVEILQQCRINFKIKSQEVWKQILTFGEVIRERLGGFLLPSVLNIVNTPLKYLQKITKCLSCICAYVSHWVRYLISKSHHDLNADVEQVHACKEHEDVKLELLSWTLSECKIKKSFRGNIGQKFCLLSIFLLTHFRPMFHLCRNQVVDFY